MVGASLAFFWLFQKLGVWWSIGCAAMAFLVLWALSEGSVNAVDMWLRRTTKDDHWLASHEGRAWLETPEGKAWKAQQSAQD